MARCPIFAKRNSKSDSAQKFAPFVRGWASLYDEKKTQKLAKEPRGEHEEPK